MPGAEHGFARAISDLIVGFVVSAIVTEISGETGGVMSALLLLASMILVIELLSKMNHWSLLYLMGYILGLSLFGPHLLSSWEFAFSFIVGIIYMMMKGSRKIRGKF